MQPDVNSPSRSHMTVGSVVADTYKLERLLGRGGMGDVFLASHLRLPGSEVAIKFLHPEVADQEIVARFRREAFIASRLGHPNIVRVTDINDLPDGTPYVVLELLQGQTLDDALANGPFSVERTLPIARQICGGLAAAHRAGVVHRDLKPQNIFLVPTELEGRVVDVVKILDFGISKMRDSNTVKTQESSLLGTPQYMSPEQAFGKHDLIDGRTDIFALGAILYEMLTGQPAFSGASIPEVLFKVAYEPALPLAERVPGTPPNVVAVIERAMAKKPEERFATVDELVQALTGVALITLPSSRHGSGLDVRPPSGKVSSADALAGTIGSGDHAAAMQATSNERPAGAGTGPALPPAFPAGTANASAAATAASGTGRGGGFGPDAGFAGTIAAPSTAPGNASSPASNAALGHLAGHAADYASGAVSGHAPRAIAPASGNSMGLAHQQPPANVAPPGTARWKWIAIALAALTAAIAAFAIVRGRPPAQPEVASNANGAPTAPLPQTPPSPPPVTDDTVAPTPGGNESGSAAAPTPTPAPGSGEGGSSAAPAQPIPPPKPEKPIKPNKPSVPKDEPKDPPVDEGEAGPAKETLQKAWQAAESKDDRTAKRLANSILDSADSPRPAKIRARQILAFVACRADDREAAVNAAKNAGRLPAKVLDECKKHDIELARPSRPNRRS